MSVDASFTHGTHVDGDVNEVVPAAAAWGAVGCALHGCRPSSYLPHRRVCTTQVLGDQA